MAVYDVTGLQGTGATLGKPVIWNATSGKYDLGDGSGTCVGVISRVYSTVPVKVDVRLCGRVLTAQSDLVPGTDYYVSATGTFTAVVGAASQRVGVAVSKTDIEMDLEFMAGKVVSDNLPFATSSADDGKFIVLDSTAPGGLAATPLVEQRVATFDGGSAPIVVNDSVDWYFPHAATLTGWFLMSPDGAATCSLGLWLGTKANYKAGTVPVVGGKITGTAYPALTADQAQDETDIPMTDWTVAIPADSILRVNIDANSDATRLEFWLRYMRGVG